MSDFNEYSRKLASVNPKNRQCINITVQDGRHYVYHTDARDGHVVAACIEDKQGRFIEEIRNSAYRNITVLKL